MKTFFIDLLFISVVAFFVAMIVSFFAWGLFVIVSIILHEDASIINPWWVFFCFFCIFLILPYLWKNWCDASKGESPAIISKILSLIKEKLSDIKNWYIENNIASNVFLVINAFSLFLYYFFTGSLIWLIVLFVLSLVAFLFVKILIIKKDDEEN